MQYHRVLIADDFVEGVLGRAHIADVFIVLLEKG